MVANNFEDPQSFLPDAVFDYLAPSPSEKTTATEWSRCPGIAKRFPHFFIVRERVPGMKDRHLSVGPESDYPAEVLNTPRHADSVVVATLVKERASTWTAIDWLAELLSKVLGREIRPEQIRHSGLKDRWAITAQSIVIFGVTVDELRRVSWPRRPDKAGFFLKDIHWHDGRTRLHPSADEKRNTVYTETVSALVARPEMNRFQAAELVRQHLVKSLKREIRSEDVKFVGDKRLRIAWTTSSELDSVDWSQCPVRLADTWIYKSNTLSKGDHRQNRFEIKIVCKGKQSAELRDYLNPLMRKLERRSYCIPNAICYQRLAARQLGHLHGYTFITGDYQAPAGVHKFGSNSEAALYRFLHETSGRENPAAEQMRRDMEPYWLYDFHGMKQLLQRSYRGLNLGVEYKLVERLADLERYRGDFQEVVRSMSEEVSIWVAAWHSWWWNRVLVRKLPHWIREMDDAANTHEAWSAATCNCSDATKEEVQRLNGSCRCDNERCKVTIQRDRALAGCPKCKLESRLRRFNPLQKGIPLLLDSPQAREYYQRLPYCSEALEQLKKADNFVRNQFLRPRGNTPWRKAFIKVESLSYSVADQEVAGENCAVVDLVFDLPSGAYATTFLGCLFKLEEPKPGANRNTVVPDSEPADLVEETE
ncbi:MAG: tRNA pseudouridine(13) synthase TruD [Candidatus Obscuribacterales bacterium]|nr:tRNA pseudouridine(13) synthase TruD [Candidatus Obscuribacterales bacterium]